MTLLFLLTLNVLLQRNTPLFLFTSLTLNAFLTIWCSGQTALFLSDLAKTALAYLPTALSVASRPPFSFQQARYAHVFPLSLRHPARSLLVSAAPTSLPFLFSFPTILLSLCPHHPVLSFMFPFTTISVRNCFLSSPVLSDYNGSPDIRFFWTTTRLISWPDGKHYLFPQQCLVVALFLSPVSTFLGLEAYCLI